MGLLVQKIYNVRSKDDVVQELLGEYSTMQTDDGFDLSRGFVDEASEELLELQKFCCPNWVSASSWPVMMKAKTSNLVSSLVDTSSSD